VSIVLGAATLVLIVVLGTPRVVADLYWLDLLVGAATAAGLVSLTRGGGDRIRRVLDSRLLVALGQFSYSLYLIHSPLLLAAWLLVIEPLSLSLDGKILLMLTVVVPIVVLLAWGFSMLFERPFLNTRLPSARAESEQERDGTEVIDLRDARREGVTEIIDLRDPRPAGAARGTTSPPVVQSPGTSGRADGEVGW
jgi:peptidoglycan/LPS O-acetylase OafA/YrhL